MKFNLAVNSVLSLFVVFLQLEKTSAGIIIYNCDSYKPITANTYNAECSLCNQGGSVQPRTSNIIGNLNSSGLIGCTHMNQTSSAIDSTCIAELHVNSISCDSVFPFDLTHFPKLKILEIKNVKEIDFADSKNVKNQLETISIKNVTKALEIPDNMFQHMENVTDLDIQGCHIKSLTNLTFGGLVSNPNITIESSFIDSITSGAFNLNSTLKLQENIFKSLEPSSLTDRRHLLRNNVFPCDCNETKAAFGNHELTSGFNCVQKSITYEQFNKGLVQQSSCHINGGQTSAPESTTRDAVTTTMKQDSSKPKGNTAATVMVNVLVLPILSLFLCWL